MGNLIGFNNKKCFRFCFKPNQQFLPKIYNYFWSVYTFKTINFSSLRLVLSKSEKNLTNRRFGGKQQQVQKGDVQFFSRERRTLVCRALHF